MKSDQTAIYYLTGPSRRAVEHSPHLEAFQEKGFEVLYMTDPVDEMFVQWQTEFEGKTAQVDCQGYRRPCRGRQPEGERARVFNID